MSTSSNLKVSPDDVCVLCETTRENHGDKRHLFSLDGSLIEVEPGLPARDTPPKERRHNFSSPQSKALSEDPTSKAFLRLVELLITKELLDAKEVLFILGGTDAPK